MVDLAAEHQHRTGVELLWGTANLFSNPRYQAGAATNPDPEVFAYAAAQVAHCLEATHRLGGHNYVLWGGREGYDTLLNTDLRRELDQLARFLSMVVEHKQRIGFSGTILIEPKPFEPTKHQYDFDVAAVYAFLQRYDLADEIKVNIEVNHATLSGHDFAHEIAVAVNAGIFGSVDANAGDDRLGWDVDRFPVSAEQMTLGLLEIVRGGGLTTGGLNFDAKLRRQSIDRTDLFHGHIGGMDTMARALLAAVSILEDGELDASREARYAAWDGELGRSILDGSVSLASLRDRAYDRGEPTRVSGRQEQLENLVARHLARVR
jgi:xylose isomerase